MKVAVISFTRAGAKIAVRLKRSLSEAWECQVYIKKKFWPKDAGEWPKGIRDWEGNAGEWTRERFQDSQGIIYIGAVGIAVRLIAPWIQDKGKDSAVVVIDEKGKYAISLLSGHLGGANRLARQAAEALGAEPVITTATDLNSRFAVDVFAEENGLILTDRRLAKEISAEILDGGCVRLFSDFPVVGQIPQELYILKEEDWKKGLDRREHGLAIAITAKLGGTMGCKGNDEEKGDSHVLFLIPRCMVLGIGCRKGIEESQIWEAVEEFCQTRQIDKRSIYRVGSIDKKAEEKGILALAERLGAEFLTYTAKELLDIPGEFQESEFVRQTVGVGNVCERAAALGAMGEDGSLGQLFGGRLAKNGITVAAAVRRMEIRVGNFSEAGS
ncbi:cobalt-precorrin 5A hydrolase [Lachnospiraceae bacterium 62-35]